MSYDYSENVLVQDSAGHLLENELGWEVKFAYNTEVLGENGTFGRKSYNEIVLVRYLRATLRRFNPWITDAGVDSAIKTLTAALSTSSLMYINEGMHLLKRDGVQLTICYRS